MSIQRYEEVFVDECVAPQEGGRFVLHTDHVAIAGELAAKMEMAQASDAANAAEVERLTAERDVWLQNFETLNEKVERIEAERDAAVRKRDAAVEALRHVCKHLCQWKDACETGCLVSAALAEMEQKS